jgi:hypothetical protein
VPAFRQYEHDRLLSQVALAHRIGRSPQPVDEPFDERGDGIVAFGDHPQLHINGTTGVFGRVVRTPAEPRRTPVPRHDLAPAESRKRGVVDHAEDDVDVADPSLTSDVVLRAALGERHDARLIPPSLEMRLTEQQSIPIGKSDAPRRSRVGAVELRVGTALI